MGNFSKLTPTLVPYKYCQKALPLARTTSTNLTYQSTEPILSVQRVFREVSNKVLDVV